MPYYYCDTCRKLLEPKEQRHNQETTTHQGPMVFGHWQNTPVTIGIPLKGNKTVDVVRCITCGSDARIVAHTPDEYKFQDALAKEAKNENIIVIISGLVTVILFLLFVFLGRSH